MNDSALPTASPQQLIEQLLEINAGQKLEIESLKEQLAWFKRQLFGQKSEKRLIVQNPDQISIADILASPQESTAPEIQETITYKRRRKKARADDCVTDQGLRFTSDVPVEIIEEPAPQL